PCNGNGKRSASGRRHLLDTALEEDNTELRRSSPQRVERGPVRELHTARASCNPSSTASHRNDSEWRKHDATSGSLEPKPKGEGTVWQSARLNLIGPGRNHLHRETTERGLPRGWPGVAGPQSAVITRPASRSTWRGALVPASRAAATSLLLRPARHARVQAQEGLA